MAQVVEELLVFKISRLERDGVKNSPSILTDEIKAALITDVESVVEEQAQISVIVELVEE